VHDHAKRAVAAITIAEREIFDAGNPACVVNPGIFYLGSSPYQYTVYVQVDPNYRIR